MNNEILLFDYIKSNNGITTNYKELAEKFKVSKTTIKNWKNILVDKKLITCKCKVINNKKQLILTLKETK